MIYAMIASVIFPIILWHIMMWPSRETHKKLHQFLEKDKK